MDDFKRFRYDFFGELLKTQEEINNEKSKVNQGHDNLEIRNGNDNRQEHNNQPLPFEMDKAPSEDSLMEFITDYFQGDVAEDFTIISQSIQENLEDQPIIPQMNAFECSSNSDPNNSTELFTSPETSMINMDCNCNSDGICDDDLLSPPPQENQHSSRRKSISYDIVFTNSKEQNGKVKLHIVPNQKRLRDKTVNEFPPASMPQPKKENQSIQQENTLLRQRVQDLEQKLHCLEMESERVVGELSRIIERKNEAISQLELQIAGVRMEN